MRICATERLESGEERLLVFGSAVERNEYVGIDLGNRWRSVDPDYMPVPDPVTGAVSRINDREYSHYKTMPLRETKMYWIGEGGERFRKSDGIQAGKFPIYKLNISSIG